MDSYYSSTAAANDRRRAAQAGQATSGATGYRHSSDVLNAGLEVRTISLTALPLELVAELVRMRRLWGGADESSSADIAR